MTLDELINLLDAIDHGESPELTFHLAEVICEFDGAGVLDNVVKLLELAEKAKMPKLGGDKPD